MNNLHYKEHYDGQINIPQNEQIIRPVQKKKDNNDKMCWGNKISFICLANLSSRDPMPFNFHCVSFNPVEYSAGFVKFAYLLDQF